jgi:hypothetical protein
MVRLVLSIFLTVLTAAISLGQPARLQVIHNAADPAAASVDVYLNGSLLLDNFEFRKATPFVDVPSGVPLNIGVAPGSSTSASDTLRNFTVTLAAGKKYTAIANGIVGSGFASNPDGLPIAFTLFAADRARESARWSWFVDLRAFHGATDAPTVGLHVRGKYSASLSDGLSYGQFTSYKSLLPGKYVVDVTVNGGQTVVASFAADLSGLRGGAAVVFASGFLNQAANQNGPAFGLFAALPNGTVVPLPSMATARLQVIHNAADPAAASVDVYVDGAKLLDNFEFRKATPFVDVPAGVIVNIGIAGPNSASAADTLKNIPVVFTAGKNYVAVANGVLDPNSFAANPDARPIGFQLFATDDAREKGRYSWLVDIAVLHGSTDAPTVDVKLRGLPYIPLFNDVTYGEITAYKSFPAWVYALQITPGSSSTVLATFLADLRGLKGGAAMVFASGFLSPAANQNGAAFGLFAALPNGTVVELPALSSKEAAAVPALSPEAEEFFGVTETLPSEVALEQNYPNPFNPTTTIAFNMPEAGFVSLKVYNLIGQEVATLVDETKEAGSHSVTFNAEALTSGVYLYKLQAAGTTITKKFTLLK